MSDPERELTPEQEGDVRRLLAEVRATEPIPAEVAARLDSVLVGLHEERGGVPASVHQIAPIGRRRRATALLVAAAAVVAVGVGFGQLTQTSTDSDDGGGASDNSLTAERAPEAASGGDSSDQETDTLPPQEAGPKSSSAPPTPTPVGRVRESSFAADANQLRRAIPGHAADGQFAELRTDQLPPRYVLAGRAFECAPAHWGPGVLVPVLAGNVPAVLAYRPVMGESQVVELLACGTAELLRTTTLQAS